MTHVIGQSRYQATLFPEILDEIVAPDCQVLVIDAFVDMQFRGDERERRQFAQRFQPHRIAI